MSNETNDKIDDVAGIDNELRGDVSATTETALADAALMLALDPTTKKELKSANSLALAIVVPNISWVGPVATAVRSISHSDVHIHTWRANGKYSTESTSSFVALLLNRGRTVVGISHETALLPDSLMAVARKIEIARPNYDLVAATMKRCMVGKAPPSLRRLNFGGLSFNVLCACMQTGFDKREAAKRLKTAVANQSRKEVSALGAVDLEHAVEFGQARIWGLDLAMDIADYRNKRLDWASVDRGVIVHGPPGTGKTSFAAALAKKCGVGLTATSIPALFADNDGHLGVVIKALRQTFSDARENLPNILFFDEIDALPDTSRLGERDRNWWAPIVAEFLLQLDSSVSARDGLVVIGATNNILKVSPAVLRPGRLERAIYIGPPDVAGLERVLRHHLGQDLRKANLSNIVEAGLGATSAVVMEWVRAARRVARRQGRSILLADLELQIFPADSRSEEDRWRTAVHEAGHVVCGIELGMTLQRVSIRKDQVSFGRTLFVADPGFMTQTNMERELVMLLAGQAAEAAVFGSISAGGGGVIGSDLHRATEIAASMRGLLGMRGSKMWHGASADLASTLSSNSDLSAAVDQDLRRAYLEAEAIVKKEMNWITEVASLLMTYGEVGHEMVMGARQPISAGSGEAA